jgi:hypothetical protein
MQDKIKEEQLCKIRKELEDLKSNQMKQLQNIEDQDKIHKSETEQMKLQ